MWPFPARIFFVALQILVIPLAYFHADQADANKLYMIHAYYLNYLQNCLETL